MDRIAKTITDQWWLVALRGVLAVIFGATAWVWPDITLFTLVVLFGTYALLGGVMSLGAAFARHRQGASPWPLAIQGLLGIGIGAATLVWPDLSATALLYVIAAWAIVTGVFDVIAAIELRKVVADEWLMGLSGVASIAFGVLAALDPEEGALALVWTIGAYAIVSGVLLVVHGLRLHGWGRQLSSATA